MKRSQIILLGIALFISGAMYIPILMNAKEYEKQTTKENKTVYVPTTVVKNQVHNVPLNSYGQVSPNTELMVSFEVQGKLLKGDKRLKPGVSFRKGELLYKIEASEYIATIISRKMALLGVVSQSMADFSLDFPNRKEIWERFMLNLKGDSPLPRIPLEKSERERLFWASRNVYSEYYNILSQEHRYEKYLYTAPFSGTVTEVYSEPGSIVNPGVQIAKIARTGEFELKVPVSLDDLDKYKTQKSARFTDPNGKLIATGAIIRISDVVNQRTQSADVYYSVKPVEGERVYNGLYLNVEIDYISDEQTVALPRRALKDDKVLVLKGDKLSYIDVDLKSRKPDTVYVTGLQNGQEVVLEQTGAPGMDIIYKSERK